MSVVSRISTIPPTQVSTSSSNRSISYGIEMGIPAAEYRSSSSPAALLIAYICIAAVATRPSPCPSSIPSKSTAAAKVEARTIPAHCLIVLKCAVCNVQDGDGTVVNFTHVNRSTRSQTAATAQIESTVRSNFLAPITTLGVEALDLDVLQGEISNTAGSSIWCGDRRRAYSKQPYVAGCCCVPLHRRAVAFYRYGRKI